VAQPAPWADFPLAPLIGVGCALIVGFITAVASPGRPGGQDAVTIPACAVGHR